MRASWKSWRRMLGQHSTVCSTSDEAGSVAWSRCRMFFIPRFILPVCPLMALSCLHPRGLIASHLSKCAWGLKGVYRFVRIPESLPGPCSLWSVKASVCLCFSSSLLSICISSPLAARGDARPSPCRAPRLAAEQLPATDGGAWRQRCKAAVWAGSWAQLAAQGAQDGAVSEGQFPALQTSGMLSQHICLRWVCWLGRRGSSPWLLPTVVLGFSCQTALEMRSDLSCFG